MSDIPFIERQNKGDVGRKAERQAAKRLVVPGSGSQIGNRGDIRREDFLIESKATEKQSMSIKLEWLRKISKEALQDCRDPALMIQFVDHHGRPVRDGAWVAVPERVWRELFDGRE